MRSSAGPVLLALTLAAATAGAGVAWGASAGDQAPVRPPAADVVGGNPVQDGDRWRDAAAVYFGNDNQPSCSGVLVAPTIVLTARHCLGNVGRVLLGATRFDQPDGEFIDVRAEYANPTLDVGALLLDHASTVAPRVIASGCVIDAELENGAPVAIVGYGTIDENGSQITGELREAFTTVVDADCSTSAGCQLVGQEIGAGGGGIDSCTGDSGGPLYLVDQYYDYLLGTTSRGFSDSNTLCSQGGIYERSDAIIDWLEEVAQVQIPRATCNEPPEPTAGVLDAEPGKIGSTRIKANDPDGQGAATFRVTTPPAHGEATVDEDGKASYRSEPDYEGEDSFTVEVTDDGVPALSVPLQIDVVVAPDTGCGCRSGRGRSPAGLLLVLAVLVATRRRPSRSFC